MSGIVESEELISSGIHFGHRVRSWNPKMEKYIYKKRNGIHIIDIKETIRGLIRAQRFVEMVVAEGKEVLFVGTKRQASASVLEIGQNLSQPYVAERWLGGILTNHQTVRQRLVRLEELEQIVSHAETSGFSKKAIASMNREYRKIHRNLNGIRKMDEMPGVIIIVDINREHNAVAEARRMKIPTVALVDTDSDPDLVDVVVPGNDDALKAINLFLKVMSDGVQNGLAKRPFMTTAPKDQDRKKDEGKEKTETTKETFPPVTGKESEEENLSSASSAEAVSEQ
jgi:small subunit ribosomal protein S2